MGDPPKSSDAVHERPAATPERSGAKEERAGDAIDRGGTSAEEQARIDREAGDVADDIADFA